MAILLLIILIVISVFLFNVLLETIEERGFGPFPKKLTLFVCCFLVVHWVLLFINGYMQPHKQMGGEHFFSKSFALGILGNLCAIREVNHNRFVAVVLGCFSTFSILFTYMVHGISKM
ncbi:hypothetical protein N780_01375 [Pontibacillus chungwhensis BH030062]|uniref:Uncharacterized protein n=1 Tax=Pontibacillus chungwhensis BH030062 TaxID=1385513 RepID=A0A0A2V058_9BACI|nr:hypothetical protein [Pontibacillus chungwhensis]KGP92378.1 hypothetical protein N780_01375 [Pontibacillus chungwhensis BH030062]